MPVEHVNRKGDRYYLQSGKTRSGKTRYYFEENRDENRKIGTVTCFFERGGPI